MPGYQLDPYTQTYNTDVVREALTRRYGQRYLDYRERWARSERFEVMPFPINLVFDLINVCNLKCPMCLRSEDLIDEYPELKASKVKLSVPEVVAALDEGREHGLPSVNIGGSGECTLHPDFLEFCRAAMERDVMELRIISNGIRLTPAIAQGLIDMQATMLSISIDAFSAETYGKVRGKPDQYAEVLANIETFLDLRGRAGSRFPLLRVTFVPQPGNHHERKAYVDHWTQRADMVDVQVFSAYGAKQWTNDFECSDPFRRLNVWASKKVGPCCGFPGIDYDMGTLGPQTLMEIWNGEPMRQIRRELLTKTYRQPCLRCQGTRTRYDD